MTNCSCLSHTFHRDESSENRSFYADLDRNFHCCHPTSRCVEFQYQYSDWVYGLSVLTIHGCNSG